MLSTAIIIFREAFEIALILGVVLAATRGLHRRGHYVWGGFVAGAAGAGLIALFIDRISDAFEGMGQELMNAAILFVAAFFIGWTAVWMRTHAREAARKLKQVGSAVKDEQMPYIALSLVISAAVLREGAEIALFTYSMIAAGQAAGDILLGGLLGAGAGAGLGTLIYLGLVRISTRYLFTVTTTLLTLLVCGLMAVGTGFLVSAGYFSDYSATLWDSNWLLAENSLGGQTLHVLVGYIAQPMEIQLIAYLATLFVLISLMFWLDRRSNASLPPRAAVAAVMMLGIFLALAPEAAHATKRIYAPYVEQGEMEFEVLAGQKYDDNGDVDGAQKAKFALGYGMTDRWFTELYFEVEKEGEHGSNFKSTAVEWENRFQLTEQGEYWMDVGLYLAYEATLESQHADKMEGKLLLAKDTGKFTHLANLILESDVGGHAEEQLGTGLALGTRYRYSPHFEPGLEWYSEFGAVNHMGSVDEQEHQFGPAFYGHVPGTPLAYDIGYLFGVSSGAPDGELKLILEYETRF